MADISSQCDFIATKRFKKIPIYVVEEHNDALQFIYSAIGGKKLPIQGTTLVHLDAHPDMLIDRKLKGEEARAGKNLLPSLQIENWIVPAAAAGHIDRVVWIHPPWAKQFADGTRIIQVGDHPDTGLLRVDNHEPYYLSDALYSSRLINKKTFSLTVKELSNQITLDENYIEDYGAELNVTHPFVLDIDLDFFSTGNPFLFLYKNIGLYDRLEPIFRLDLPSDNEIKALEECVEIREKQLDELEMLFQHLEEHDELTTYKGNKSKWFYMVFDLATAVKLEAERLGERPDWWAVFAGGCTRDQGGLPYHISTEAEIRNYVENVLKTLLKFLPQPVMITVARSTEDGYCPPDQVDFIQSLVLDTLKDVYDADDPSLFYLTVNTY